MKEILEEDITKELDNIYGIEESKWEIMNYVKYLEISKEKYFANYNVIIYNRSSYPTETKIKLINFLHKMLKKHKIIKSDYEFINMRQLRKFEINNEKYNREEIENFNLKSDLIIIDSEKVGRNLEGYRDEISAMIEKFKNKVFIIVDEWFCKGESNAAFSPYFDWFFEIDSISEKNKKDYIFGTLSKNKIEVEENCNYIDNLAREPFFVVKSKINNVILQCKLNDITNITDKIAEKYFDEKNIPSTNTKDKKENSTKQKEEKLSFDSMIGINEIKKEINKIVNYVKICKKRNKKMPCLHMCFTGNPGTGKTTVARIIGQMFKDEGILSRGNFVEIHGRDLVGQYVGWTAKETQRHVNRAKGGVLFIDEAYSLNADRRGSFEDEAIATLIKEMEDKRDDLCVILAGYKKEMNDLIKLNPGFESRIQFYLDFPNYNTDELYEIFKNLAKGENYKLSSSIKPELEKALTQIVKTENFSNGRFIRNIYEKVKIEQANRVSENKGEDINLIKKCDLEKVLAEIKVNKKEKVKIGFC